MTSLSCGVDALLRAAQFIEEQELGQVYQPIVLERSQLSTEETKPSSESLTTTTTPPSLVVISHPVNNFTPQPVTIDLSKNSVIPLGVSNLSSSNVNVYNIDESQTSLNLSAESSGYVSNSTTSSLNQSATNGDYIDSEKPSLQSTFSALPMPPSASNGRRRTISSNSNSSTLRSPSTVRAGTREVHNKLEKNRRAHLKECFEALKKQLPITPDEKKTSNLSILGAAIRHITFLKRKEREFEHEMERLAKDKIAAQNRILFLKRELAQWDIDFTKLIPEQTDIIAVKSERSDLLNDGSVKGNLMYSSTSSLSSIAITTSPASTSNYATSTNLSPNIIALPSSPPRMTMINNCSPMVPLSTMTPKSKHDDVLSKVTINPIKMLPNSSTKTQMMTNTPTTVGIHNQMPSGMNLIAGEIPSSYQSMSLNLQAAISSIPQMNGVKNGLKGCNSKDSNKSLSPVITSTISTSITPTQITTHSENKRDPNEPPTKLIKLINGSAILAPMDKDSKMLHSGQLTLQQVVGGGGLVVSPIQLVASSQGFKVIGQPNGVTTIELSTPSTHINGHPTNAIHHRSHQLTSHSQPGNLQKLLMNGNANLSSSNNNAATIAQQGANGSRLAPGGAELNLLPSNTTNSGAIYRNQGKLAIKETTNSNRVHVMQSTPTIVMSQPQNINIITSSPQFVGKMMPSGPQFLNAKPMIVMNHNGNGSSTSPSIESGKIHN